MFFYSLWRLLGIKWYQFVSNAEVQRTSGQPLLTSTIQAQHLSLFGHIARLDDSADAKKILTAPCQKTGRDRMKTVLNDLESHNLTLTEAVSMAQNRAFWRL